MCVCVFVSSFPLSRVYSGALGVAGSLMLFINPAHNTHDKCSRAHINPLVRFRFLSFIFNFSHILLVDFRFISFISFSDVISSGQVQGSLTRGGGGIVVKILNITIVMSATSMPASCLVCVLKRSASTKIRPQKKPQQQHQNFRCLECFEVFRTSHRVTMVFYGVSI